MKPTLTLIQGGLAAQPETPDAGRAFSDAVSAFDDLMVDFSALERMYGQTAIPQSSEELPPVKIITDIFGEQHLQF